MLTTEKKPNPDLAVRLGRIGVESLIRQLPESDGKIGTDAVRSIDVLLQLIAERPTWLSDSQRNVLAASIMPQLLTYKPHDADSELPNDAENRKMLLWYRRACLIVALSRLLEWVPGKKEVSPESAAALGEARSEAGRTLKSQAKLFVKELADGDIANSPPMHPFIACQLLLALGQLEKPNFVTSTEDVRRELRKPLDERLVRLLANHQLGLDNASESVALAFAAAATALLVGEEAGRQTRAALAACLASYERSVGWEQGRVICQNSKANPPRHQMVVPGAEVYCAVGAAALAAHRENGFLDGDGEAAAPPAVLELLERGLQIAEDSKVDGTAPPGWATDQVLDSKVTELWPTAAVLKLAIVADELRHRGERQWVLEARDAKPTWGDDWPGWLDWPDYRDKADPELGSDHGILEFIDEEIVKPRADESAPSQNKAVIVLLFGPPGTTKTTIARAVAGGLRWPLVTLSPGNFIEEGLNRVEARAGKIFDELERISRTVVIFDECDELFRARSPAPETESFRNVSAFMTASMLPKLQDLHDRGRVVVFICTNFLSSIDPAMRRIGRIDHLIAVGPPNKEQRRVTIERELDLVDGQATDKGQEGEEFGFLVGGIDELVEQTEHFIRGELVNAAREFGKARPFQSADGARYKAHRIANGTASTIDPTSKDFEQFLRDKEELSEPHRRGDS